MMEYNDPILTVAVLDYAKPIEARLCLESIKRHVLVPHKVVFCDNGSGEDYPLSFMREGLIDQLIVNRESLGLGLGTRDVMHASFSSITLMMQNDQLFMRDLTENDFATLTSQFGVATPDGRIASINLAGPIAPKNRYAERAHLINTWFYRDMEQRGVLGYHGAGRFHDGPWREEQIQKVYADNQFIHWTPTGIPWVKDNGVYAVRDMGEGGVFCHRTDTKACWVIVPPIGPKNPAYPKMTDAEYELAKKDEWQDGRIPEMEIKDSFDCWSGSELVKMEGEYITDLRRRFKEKGR